MLENNALFFLITKKPGCTANKLNNLIALFSSLIDTEWLHSNLLNPYEPGLKYCNHVKGG